MPTVTVKGKVMRYPYTKEGKRAAKVMKVKVTKTKPKSKIKQRVSRYKIA